MPCKAPIFPASKLFDKRPFPGWAILPANKGLLNILAPVAATPVELVPPVNGVNNNDAITGATEPVISAAKAVFGFALLNDFNLLLESSTLLSKASLNDWSENTLSKAAPTPAPISSEKPKVSPCKPLLAIPLAMPTSVVGVVELESLFNSSSIFLSISDIINYAF